MANIQESTLWTVNVYECKIETVKVGDRVTVFKVINALLWIVWRLFVDQIFFLQKSQWTMNEDLFVESFQI